MDKRNLELKTKVLQLSITEGCNSRCIYCNFWKIDKPKHLTLDDIDKLFDVIDYDSLDLLCLTGGEPTEHPQIKDMIVFITDRIKKPILLSTNCLNYNRLENIVLTMGKRIHTISTSFDGDENAHNRNRGVKSAYKNVLRGLQLAEENGIRTKLAVTVTSQNVDQISLLLRRYSDARLDIKTAHLSSVYYGNNTEKKDLQRQKSSIYEQVYQQLKDYYMENDVKNLYTFYNGIYVRYGIRPICTVGLTEFFVFPNGDIYACYSKGRLTNLKETSKEELNRLRRDFNNSHASCTDCFARCSSSVVQIFNKYYEDIANQIVTRWRRGEKFPEKEYFDAIRNL